MNQATTVLSAQLMGRLRESAMQAASRSYSPYSGFPVGAAVIDSRGTIYTGCNVENASLGLTQCAERAALTCAIAAGAAAGSLQALVLYTPGARIHAPCGACRQVMHELMAPDSMVASCCDGDGLKTWTHAEYLPDPFLPEDLREADEDDR